MPIATQLAFVQATLDGLEMPYSLGQLAAYIEPPPGAVDGTVPTAYVWVSSGDESRLAVPRAPEGNLDGGGQKQQDAQVSVYLKWVNQITGDPAEGLWWPACVDAVMARLRNVALLDRSQHALDPVTGRNSSLVDVGERMSWEMAAPRGIEGNQTLRLYDALVTVSMTDIYQA